MASYSLTRGDVDGVACVKVDNTGSLFVIGLSMDVGSFCRTYLSQPLRVREEWMECNFIVIKRVMFLNL